MKYLEGAKKYEDYIISMRRYFHENPELSDKEDETIKRLSEELTAMGVEHVVVENGGIFATIVGNKPGDKAVMLRADVDALPVQETDDNLIKGGRSCKSKVDGVMHACGHDGHMAMMLGATKILMDNKDDIEGTVYVVFERGEEATGNCKYLFNYIHQNNIKIDTCFAIHLQAMLESGKIGINDKGMMAGSYWFKMEIEGQGGHGSRPDQSINPIAAFADIFSSMDRIRMAKLDPYEALAYSVGLVQTEGSALNVIPQKLQFGGSVRFYERELMGKKFKEEFLKLVDSTCKLHGCTYKHILNGGVSFAAVNNPELAQFARTVIGEEIGAENVSTVEPWMASESFSRYLKMWPGVFAFLGIKNDEKGVGAAHHNEAFDIDEAALYKGAAGAVKYAVEFLKSDIKTQTVGFKEMLIEAEDTAMIEYFNL